MLVKGDKLNQELAAGDWIMAKVHGTFIAIAIV